MSDNGKTILAVDDEAHILQVVSLKLKNAGFNVLTARDGEEAADIAASTSIDFVITDYQMLGINGVELATRIHQQPGKRDLPVILLTAHGLNIDQIEISRAGIACCIAKPFSPREVLSRVNTLLEQADAKLRACEQANSESAPLTVT